MKNLALAGLVLLSAAPVLAQAPPPPVRSPEVHADRRVTFRLRAPNAKEVILSAKARALAMQTDEQGVWTLTTEALAPDIYGYTFVADGVTLTDPATR